MTQIETKAEAVGPELKEPELKEPELKEEGQAEGSAKKPLTPETQLAARLRLAVLRMSRLLRQQTSGEVTQSQVSVLSSVERLESPTLGELAAWEQVQPPSMTRQVDALVAAGLLARQVLDNDRRVVRVSVTPAGQRVLQKNRSVRTAFMASRLKRLDPTERERLEELVGLLEKLVAQK